MKRPLKLTTPDNHSDKKQKIDTQIHVCNNEEIHWRSRHFKCTPNFCDLSESFPYLSPYVFVTRFGTPGFRFRNPQGLIHLAKCFLKFFYNLEWTLPRGYLCPTVPSRANYVHTVADLLAADLAAETLPISKIRRGNTYTVSKRYTNVPTGSKIRGFDIGTGANAIYVLLCATEFHWSMIGSDISSEAIQIAKNNVTQNNLEHCIDLRHQQDPLSIFKNVVDSSECFSFCMCNPPFHSTEQQIQNNPVRQLEAVSAELLCEGGELGFIIRLIDESLLHRNQFIWFTTLVARDASLKAIKSHLLKAHVVEQHVIALFQGKHTRWVVAWTFCEKSVRFKEASKCTS